MIYRKKDICQGHWVIVHFQRQCHSQQSLVQRNTRSYAEYVKDNYYEDFTLAAIIVAEKGTLILDMT